MTPEQFCYWLQGRVELVTEPPTAEQWKSIGEHLALTFKKVTPPLTGGVVHKPGPDFKIQDQLLRCATRPLQAIC